MRQSIDIDGLKPCPFCGAFPETSKNGQIVCTNKKVCKCISMTFTRNDPAGAWNTRPIEDALKKRITELEAEVDQAITEWSKAICAYGELSEWCDTEIEKLSPRWVKPEDELPPYHKIVRCKVMVAKAIDTRYAYFADDVDYSEDSWCDLYNNIIPSKDVIAWLKTPDDPEYEVK